MDQVQLVAKHLPAKAGDSRDVGLIPGLGRFPGGGNGSLLMYFFFVNYFLLKDNCFENSAVFCQTSI